MPSLPMPMPPPPQKLEDDDSEDDPDFVPPPGGNEGESDSSLESGSEKASRRRHAKRHKLGPPVESEEDRASKEEMRTKLWADFQASVSTPPPRPHPEAQKMVKIVKKYRFAGEDVTKVEEVAEDSQEAKKWPLWDGQTQPTLPKNSPAPTASPSPIASSSGTPQPDVSTPGAITTAKRVGPRKPRKSLDAMFATAKAKKLTTLDKSAMDWKEHVESSRDIKEDLEANRRSGGYLEKVDFLQRVEQRTEAAREGAKKRRRG